MLEDRACNDVTAVLEGTIIDRSNTNAKTKVKFDPNNIYQAYGTPPLVVLMFQDPV